MNCKKCGRELAADAKFCAGCGQAVTTGFTAKRIAGIIALLFVGLVVVSAFGEGGSGSSSRPPVTDVERLKTSAQELFAAYQDNEAAAQARFGGQPLLVTGTVAGVDLDLTNDPVVKLETSNRFMPAQASLTDAAEPLAAGLSKGQEITLRCDSVGEVVGTPMLRDCSF